jgi:hypothetical protein
MSFLVPAGASAESVDGFRRACLAGGYDHSPTPTRVEFSGDRLTLRRDIDESAHLQIGWDIEGAGRFVGTTATLMERISPYQLVTELARGKINQVRNQLSEWESVGLQISDSVTASIRRATKTFGQALLEIIGPESNRLAGQALSQAYDAAEQLVQLYVDQLFALRHQRITKLESALACRVPDVPDEAFSEKFRAAFNTVCVPFTWKQVEPNEANYQWDAVDRVVNWGQAQGLSLTAGPLLDFSSFGLPEWLRPWEGDLPSLASFMCDYIETVLTRYKSRIRRWLICSSTNCSRVLGLGEDDLIRLTARLAEAAWGIDSGLEVVVGLSQPWGDYRAGGDFNYSPFVFADTLLRAGLPFAAFELEWFMGTWPRGSYCRDRLEASRLLDMFGMLGVPMQVSLSYPSVLGVDRNANDEQNAGRNGNWHDVSPQSQASWAKAFAEVALCKTHISGVYWNNFHDGQLHLLPNCGLVDAEGVAKPALDILPSVKSHVRDGAPEQVRS